MSLDWNLTKIKDYEAVCFTAGEMNDDTEFLVFATMHVGLYNITAKNVDKWELRLEMLRQIGVLKGGLPSREVLEAHIGLSTNAHPAKTDHQFRARVSKHIEEAARRSIASRSSND